MPLLRSTSAANAAHVDSSRAFTVYLGSTMKPSLVRAAAGTFSSRTSGGAGWLADAPANGGCGR